MTAALLPVAAGGLTDLNFTLFWATLILFAIFAFVMAKLAWNPLLAMIEVSESAEGSC